jgi:uncharacterized membrane protein
MSHLVALVFSDEFKGEEARAALHRMAGEDLVSIDDSVLITRKKDGSTLVSQEDKVLARGQKAGHILGLCAAAITGTIPFILAGTLAGRLVGRLMDDGITREFVRGVKDELDPGTSALIILGSSDPEGRKKVLGRLREFGPKVLETDLPPELRDEIERDSESEGAA